MLDPDALRRAIAVACATWPDWQRADAVRVVDRIASTNTALVALTHAKQRGPRVALAARHQTDGRGRHGRRWFGAPDAALALSLGLELRLPLAALHGITLVCGLAVREAIGACGVRVALKWPNDIVDPNTRAKLGGLLVETQLIGEGLSWVVVGIGLNLRPTAELAALGAGDLGTLARGDLDANVLAACIVADVEAHAQRFSREGFAPFAAAFNAAHAYHAREVELRHDGRIIAQGQFVGVSARGEVVLLDAQGSRRTFSSGDLSLRAGAQA